MIKAVRRYVRLRIWTTYVYSCGCGCGRSELPTELGLMHEVFKNHNARDILARSGNGYA